MTAPAADAERYIAKVRSRHQTATELSRRADMDYRGAYRLLQEAEQHPHNIDLQLALRRVLGADR